LRRGIAFGVDRHEYHLGKHRPPIGAQALLHGGQRGECGGTIIRTIRIAKEEQRPVAAQIRGAKDPPLRVDQAKIRQLAAGRDEGPGGQLYGRRGAMPENPGADTRQANRTDEC